MPTKGYCKFCGQEKYLTYMHFGPDEDGKLRLFPCCAECKMRYMKIAEDWE